MIASVIVDIDAKQVNRSFDYTVPEHLEPVVKIGCRVRVVFGARIVAAFVVALKEKSEYKKTLKPIGDVIDVFPVLNEEFIELAKQMAEENFSYYSSCLKTMLPQALRIHYRKIAKIKEGVLLPESVQRLFKKRKEISLEGLLPKDALVVYQAAKEGLLILDTKIKQVRRKSIQKWIYVLDETKPLKSKQQQMILDYLLEIGEPVELSLLVEESGFSKNAVMTLLQNNVLGCEEKEYLYEEETTVPKSSFPPFSAEQEAVYHELSFDQHRVYLLFGVTGSGKTEVYMKWIDDVLKKGKTALLLVPEIALTPQITKLFKARFQSDVAIMHSRLSVFEKYSAWKKIIDEQVKIVIGARSAVFAPLKNLGIIIIDEAHEKTYRQENSPRYDAKELAVKRGKTHACPVVFGSATPDIVDYYRAKKQEYTLLRLPHRIGNQPLPTCHIVSMTEELKQKNNSVFSSLLQEKLKTCYRKKEQAILFLNRRGYASFVMCRNCGKVLLCPHCDSSLTYHVGNVLKCHHCGYRQNNVSVCPSCGSDKIRYVGSGTQKVLEEIERLLPEATVLRVDLDTTKTKADYDAAFEQFHRHQADILVGTQMIAKGLDFLNVTLVGIVNADLALHYPSYDATATAFNLIEQVAGRCGRGKKEGEVIIQTYSPDHYVIQLSAKHDYEAFYQKEIAVRKWTHMPPFSKAYCIYLSSSDRQVAYQEAQHVLYTLKKQGGKCLILGPAEALPFKQADKYRYTVQIQTEDERVLDQLKEIYPLYQNNQAVDIKIVRM